MQDLEVVYWYQAYDLYHITVGVVLYREPNKDRPGNWTCNVEDNEILVQKSRHSARQLR